MKKLNPPVSLMFLTGGQLVFTGRQNLLELNFFMAKTFLPRVKIILTAVQFAQCPALAESPEIPNLNNLHPTSLIPPTLLQYLTTLLIRQKV